jgi:hypothetical protein
VICVLDVDVLTEARVFASVKIAMMLVAEYSGLRLKIEHQLMSYVV